MECHGGGHGLEGCPDRDLYRVPADLKRRIPFLESMGLSLFAVLREV